ncbi:heparan-alpha-glucosaminide N-acetyltransferase domain-containing protein [Pseudonocardia sp. RS11V-5]|uniref:heparan-alpha-glucosaminide N-acetyltransferase domain-containing protein n=1 Tax=Pseudonocardia terrae TaxID=2905831 RepID=UPI001E6313A5|nr:heparan-alpha-glucosaminide N-acetyltransferase domain-containing protein [Pseudonocardia terrae]MCE3555287.1 heparan-alpha-glucosaminide N-acetyltransferase domain-containing protein [Pseudonocardia terrae]
MSTSIVRAGPPWAEAPTVRLATDPPTVPLRVASARGGGRVVGVDAARGAALLGMFATHVFPVLGADGAPTAPTVIAAGRAVATFVLVAGVSVAFLSGGRSGRQSDGLSRGRSGGRGAAASGLVVRAVLIGLLGLLVGFLAPRNGVDGILPFYGIFFLLAVPLLWLGPRALAAVTAVAFLLGPVALVATAGLPRADADPTLVTLLHDPGGLLLQLFLTGEYPAVVYLGYLAAGLAIGRLDLSSRRVGWGLVGGGLVLAAGSRIVSWILLYPLGGLAKLTAAAPYGDASAAEVAQRLLWEAHPMPTWWYLALPTPHGHTPIDLAHTLGCAMALLGALLLLTRVETLRRLLSPLAAAGALSLTLYCAHLVVLASGVLSGERVLLLVAMIVGALAVAVVWQGTFGRGPLETLVSVPAGAARRAVGGGRRAREAGTTLPTRRPDPFRAVAIALVVVLLGLGALVALGPGGRHGPVEPADEVETVVGPDAQPDDGADGPTPAPGPTLAPGPILAPGPTPAPGPTLAPLPPGTPGDQAGPQGGDEDGEPDGQADDPQDGPDDPPA